MLTPVWQTIDSAPKDGTRILAWDGKTQEVIWWGTVRINARDFENPDAMEDFTDWFWGGFDDEYYCYDVFEPTHWMPLPNPPQCPEVKK